MGVASAVDLATLLLYSAAAILAGTRADKTASLLAVFKAMPITDAAVKDGTGELAHTVWGGDV